MILIFWFEITPIKNWGLKYHKLCMEISMVGFKGKYLTSPCNENWSKLMKC